MCFFLLIVEVIAIPSYAIASSWSDSLKIQIDEKVRQNFFNKSQIGLIIGIINGNDTYIWSYGEKILGSQQSPTLDTFFEIGSITKTYTATLLAAEVLKGNIQLTSQVKSLWPELENTDAGEITLEELATHRSGLPRMPINFNPVDPLNPYKNYTEENLYSFLKKFKLTNKTQSYEYSNVGVGLLGYLLSTKLNKENFNRYIEKNLLMPLGLKDTKTELNHFDLLRTAQGYGNFFQLMPLWDLNVLNPAGVLKSTINDMLKYVHFHMESSANLLNQAANLTHQDRAATDQELRRIGLVWELLKIGKHSVMAHSGGTGGYRANLMFDKTKHIGAVMLSNTDMMPNCILTPIFEGECEVKKWATVDQKQQENFIGTFFSKELEMRADVFFNNNQLGLQLEGQPLLRLWPNSIFEYEIPDAEASIIFMEENNSKSKSFVISQNGRSYTFLRK